MHNAKKIINNYYLPFIIMVLTAVVTSIFSVIGVDPHHDGILLKPAIDVSNGMKLFKDTFTQYGALTTLLQALCIKIFGEYLIVIRLLTAAMYTLVSLLLYLIWSRIIPRFYNFMACIIWLCLAPYYSMDFLPWSSVYALFFQLLSLYLILKYIEQNKNWLVLLSGISCTFSFWCRQPIGMLLVIAILIFFLYSFIFHKNNVFKIINKFIIGVLTGLLIFVVWLVSTGALKDWYLQSIKLPYYFNKFIYTNNYAGAKTPILSLLFPSNLSYIWTLLPFITIVLLLTTTFNDERSNKSKYIFVISIVSFASWAQYYPIVDLRHVYWSATPMIGLFVYYIWDLIKFNKTFLKNVFAVSLVIIFFSMEVNFNFHQAYHKLKQSYVKVQVPTVLRGMKMLASDADYYNKIGEKINEYALKNPGTKLVTNGEDALYLTFLKTNKNFHSLYIQWPWVITNIYPDLGIKWNEYIAKEKPLVIGTIMDNYEPLMTMRKGNFLQYPGTNKNLFEINQFTYDNQDKIGKISSELDGVKDYVVQIKINDLVGEINSVEVESLDVNNTNIGKWDSKEDSFWIAGFYQNGKILNPNKINNLKLPFKTGDTFDIRLTGNNSAKFGAKITLKIWYNDGYVDKKTMILPDP